MDEFDELREKEEQDKKDAKSFMDMLAMMAMVNQTKQNEESEFKRIGKVLYLTYAGMIDAGFNSEQAFELTKCLIFGTSANETLKKR